MPVTGADKLECSGSRSRIVSSTRERSSPVNMLLFVGVKLFKRVFLRTHTIPIGRPLCKILPQMCPLFLRQCCTRSALVNISSLCTGVLTFKLSSTTKARTMSVKLGHKMSTLILFLVRGSLNHLTNTAYTMLSNN